MLLDHAFVEQLHEPNERPGRLAVASLDHLDLAGCDIGKGGKTGLRKTGPFSDGAE